MFSILFMEYSGKNILEFIHYNCGIGLLRKRKTYWTIFQTSGVIPFWHKSNGRYCVLIQIAKFELILVGEEKLFWEECTLEQILRWILHKNRVLTPFSYFWRLCFEIRFLRWFSKTKFQGFTKLTRIFRILSNNKLACWSWRELSASALY